MNNLFSVLCMYLTDVYQIIVVNNLLRQLKKTTALYNYSTTKLINSFFLSLKSHRLEQIHFLSKFYVFRFFLKNILLASAFAVSYLAADAILITGEQGHVITFRWHPTNAVVRSSGPSNWRKFLLNRITKARGLARESPCAPRTRRTVQPVWLYQKCHNAQLSGREDLNLFPGHWFFSESKKYFIFSPS